MAPGPTYLQWSLWLRAGIARWYSCWLQGADRIVWEWGYNLMVWVDGGAEGRVTKGPRFMSKPHINPCVCVCVSACVFVCVCMYDTHTTLSRVCVLCAHMFVKFVLICKCEITLSSSEQTEYYPQVPVVILCTHICLFDTAPLHHCTSVYQRQQCRAQLKMATVEKGLSLL